MTPRRRALNTQSSLSHETQNDVDGYSEQEELAVEAAGGDGTESEDEEEVSAMTPHDHIPYCICVDVDVVRQWTL